ncbi:hypothetical protein P5673_020424 [Acropora cervicornis]|uniref:Uncharacterized protein n=1 Tax=Acropora cervicornis TaxID=6130 RepID=A0AAD9V137_ACRCE|nr:hypothetical protein P5673_020424 [Acropora cervicornis]
MKLQSSTNRRADVTSKDVIEASLPVKITFNRNWTLLNYDVLEIIRPHDRQQRFLRQPTLPLFTIVYLSDID